MKRMTKQNQLSGRHVLLFLSLASIGGCAGRLPRGWSQLHAFVGREVGMAPSEILAARISAWASAHGWRVDVDRNDIELSRSDWGKTDGVNWHARIRVQCGRNANEDVWITVTGMEPINACIRRGGPAFHEIGFHDYLACSIPPNRRYL